MMYTGVETEWGNKRRRLQAEHEESSHEVICRVVPQGKREEPHHLGR